MNNINNIEKSMHAVMKDNHDYHIFINDKNNGDDNIQVFVTGNENNIGNNNENNENNAGTNNDNNIDGLRKITFNVKINYDNLNYLDRKIDECKNLCNSGNCCNNDYRFIFIALFFIYLVITEFIPWLLRLL